MLPNVSGHHSGHYTGHHPALLCIAPGHWHTGPHHGPSQGDIGGPAYNGEAGYYDQDMIQRVNSSIHNKLARITPQPTENIIKCMTLDYLSR